MKISDEELINELESRITEKQNALIELNKVTKQLLEVNEKLAESEALKTHFISNITNELVNPFSSIMGLSTHIAEANTKEFNQVKGMALLIYDEAFSLDFQLKNIFAAAAIEAGEVFPEYSNVNVNGTINAVVETYKHTLRKNKISLTTKINLPKNNDKPFFFKADADKLQLIISNLINNAINFGKKEGSIELKANIENNKLTIAVTDDGIGIAKKDIKSIFDRFKRLDTTINSVKRGHGLGLSVVKAYVELLDGDIDVESSEDNGSVFTVIIPEAQVDDNINDFATDGNEMFFSDEDEIF